MRLRSVLVLAILAAFPLVGVTGAHVLIAQAARASQVISAPRTVSVDCPAPALGGSLPAQIYLPAGYSSAAPRLPVVYFLHGLPADATSYTVNGFVAAALASRHRAAIVVVPQGARSHDSDREYLNWSPTEDWPTAIASDLTRCIDHRFRTIANRYGRALVGLSAGGFGAFNIGLRNLTKFGAVESWSGYFAATDAAGDKLLELGSAQADDDAQVPSPAVLNAELQRDPSYLGFYVGRQDTRFYAGNQTLDANLTAARIAHSYATYPGGHSGALWRAQAPAWLGAALDYLSRAARHR